MLNLTRIVTVVYAAAVGVAVYLWDPMQVAAVAGMITAASAALANITKDGTVIDALFSGLGVNVTAKTTVTPPPAGVLR